MAGTEGICVLSAASAFVKHVATTLAGGSEVEVADSLTPLKKTAYGQWRTVPVGSYQELS